MESSHEKLHFNVVTMYGLPGLLLAVIQASDLSKIWRTVYFAGLTAVTYMAFHSHVSTDPKTIYIVGCILAEQWLSSFQLLFIVNPIQDCRHRTDKVHPSQYPFWYRVFWCMCMRGSMRGIGWNCQVCVSFHPVQLSAYSNNVVRSRMYPRHLPDRERRLY